MENSAIYSVIDVKRSIERRVAVYTFQHLVTGEVKSEKHRIDEMPPMQVLGLKYSTGAVITDAIEITLQPYNIMQHVLFCVQREFGQANNFKSVKNTTSLRAKSNNEESGDLKETGFLSCRLETDTFYKGKPLVVRVKLTQLSKTGTSTPSMVRLEAQYIVNSKPVDDLYTCIVFDTSSSVHETCNQVERCAKEFVENVSYEVYRVTEFRTMLIADNKKSASGFLSTVAYETNYTVFAYSLESLLRNRLIRELNLTGTSAIIGSDKTPYVKEYGDDVAVVATALKLTFSRNAKKDIIHSMVPKVIVGASGIGIEVLHVYGPDTVIAMTSENYKQYKQDIFKKVKLDASKITAKAVQEMVADVIDFIKSRVVTA